MLLVLFGLSDEKSSNAFLYPPDFSKFLAFPIGLVVSLAPFIILFIDFDELVKFYGMTVAELKEKSYSELEKMEAEMTNSKSLEKLSDHNFQNAAR